MPQIPDESIDFICADLPFGTTACPWDSVIPFEPLWAEYKRIIKPTGAIALFAQQPFTSALIMSNIEMYKYNWIWQKDNGTNFLSAHHQPLKITEDICIFGKAATTESKRGVYLSYNPQMRKGFEPYKCVSGAQKKDTALVRGVCKAQDGGTVTMSDGSRFPVNILKFNRDKDSWHPTQKSVDLLRYLVMTYTSEGDVVLDNTCGSATTCVACIREKRHFIGIELNEEYYKKACERVKLEQMQPSLF
jgi:site-specific DNA-methyltransferase (adenine-specific)